LKTTQVWEKDKTIRTLEFEDEHWKNLLLQYNTKFFMETRQKELEKNLEENEKKVENSQEKNSLPLLVSSPVPSEPLWESPSDNKNPPVSNDQITVHSFPQNNNNNGILTNQETLEQEKREKIKNGVTPIGEWVERDFSRTTGGLNLKSQDILKIGGLQRTGGNQKNEEGEKSVDKEDIQRTGGTDGKISSKGTGDYKRDWITSGGLSIEEINPLTKLEIKELKEKEEKLKKDFRYKEDSETNE